MTACKKYKSLFTGVGGALKRAEKKKRTEEQQRGRDQARRGRLQKSQTGRHKQGRKEMRSNSNGVTDMTDRQSRQTTDNYSRLFSAQRTAPALC